MIFALTLVQSNDPVTSIHAAMRPPQSILVTLFLCLSANLASAQTSLGTMTFFAAQWYDSFEGEARLAEVQKLQANSWFAIDTFYEMSDDRAKAPFQTMKHLLAPFQDEDGQVVHLVPDVAPKFPGGRKALEQYKRDFLGPIASGPNDEVQNSVYIRFVIDLDGSVINVTEAQSHPNASEDVVGYCLDAVRSMPKWEPGMYRGKVVRVCRMVGFSLKE